MKYLLTGSDSSFNSSHGGILKDLKVFVRKKDLYFSNDFFNKIYSAADIYSFKFESGYNVKLVNVDLETRFHEVLRKLLTYKLEEFQRKEKIKNFRKKTAREARDDFLKKSDTNICEFFYWYRIKANYRDLEFLDKDISSEQFSDFYENYFNLTTNFCKALKVLIRVLAKKRLGKEIL